MFKTVQQHINYWKERKINWEESYFSTWNHPHRELIIEKLKKMRFGSLLEIGCASGPNLYKIQKTFANIKIGGVDINKEALDTARKLLDKNCILELGEASDVFFGDGSVDVVLTDMTLIYGNGRKIIKEIKRVARNDIILVEFHSENIFKRIGLKLLSGYSAYNYKRLLKRVGFYDIELTKIPPEAWPKEDGTPANERENQFRYVITAKR